MIQLLFQGQITVFALILFSLVLSLTFHEYGHGIVAKLYGDLTAQQQGRLTLNPIPHIDPVGLLMVVLIGFGYARPVPTDPRNYTSRWGIFMVAAAGPMMNLVIAFVVINLYGLGLSMGWSLFEGQDANMFFVFLASINIILMLFNLLPIGPLDGHYLLPYFLPGRLARTYVYYNDRYGHWLLLGIIGLALIGVPIFQSVWGVGQFLLSHLMLFNL